MALDDGGGLHDGLLWNAWSEGSLVAFQVGDLVARWEPPAALQIAAWFRQAGSQAKACAGDTGRTLSIAGTLTDANANANLNS
jgi:hypothetical protein